METILRDLLGPELYERFVQLLDPDGRPRPRAAPSLAPPRCRSRGQAQANARRGIKTFETISAGPRQVRILTMPIVERDRVVRIVQVGSSLEPSPGRAAPLSRDAGHLDSARRRARGGGRRRHRAEGAPPGRRDDGGGPPHHRRGPAPAHRAPGQPGRAGPARRDAQRHARAARRGLPADAPLRRRCGPRAAHAAHRAEGRDRGGAARVAHAGGIPAGAGLEPRGRRPAHPGGRGPLAPVPRGGRTGDCRGPASSSSPSSWKCSRWARGWPRARACT